MTITTLPRGTWLGRERARRRVRGGLVLSETAYGPGDALPLHGHERAYFCFVLRGGFVERDGPRTRECGPATVLFHPAGSAHADRFGKHGSRCLNVELDGSWLDRMAEGAGAIPDRSAALRPRRADWLARQLYDEFRVADPAADLAIEGLSLALLAEALRPQERRSHPTPAWIDRAVEILHESFPAMPGLTDIAAEVGVHPVHLARIFRRRHGCSPGQYARRLRVDRAAEALTSTDLPIAQIAHRTGFADQSHMARLFRRSKGLSPSQYRIRHRSR